MKIRKNRKYESRISTLCFILLIILIIIMAFMQEVNAIETKQYKTYIVQARDTIDEIAEKYYYDLYLPKARTEIKKLNNLVESDIYEGQVLVLEVK